MRRFACLLLAGVLGGHPLAAQTVVQPPPPLDSARAVLRDAVLLLRDSLATIDGAAGRLQRDYRAASGASLVSRARIMRDACARSIKTVPSTREVVLSAKLADPKKLKRREDLVAALDSLKGVLARCETEFAALSKADQAEAVRGYANDKAVRIQQALRSYEQKMRSFLGVMGIRILPLGASPPAAVG